MDKGFSLLELLVVLMILAIIIAFASPIYHESIYKTQRLDAKLSLLNLDNQLTEYFFKYRSYENAKLKDLLGTVLSEQKFYKLEITNLTKTTYTLTATPIDAIVKKDKTCQSFSMNQLGEKSITGKGKIAECW